MKTPTEFAEEKETKEGWLFYDDEDELLAIKLATAYVLHVLEEVEIRTRVHSSPFAQSKVIAQIRKELEG